MRSWAILAVLAILGAGVAMGYLMYRQLDTKTVALAGAPQLAPNGQGAMCGSVTFLVEPRTLGRWLFRVEEGQLLSGLVTVGSDEDADIGFRIWTPHNRLVLRDPQRHHQQEFQLQAPIRGDYTFEFDNRHSTLTEKEVAVSLCLA